MTHNNASVPSLGTGAGKDARQESGSPVEELAAGAEIARRAYEIYLERGCGPGQDANDWLQAERELKRHVEGTGETSRPRELACVLRATFAQDLDHIVAAPQEP
jgi:hypothetical protein